MYFSNVIYIRLEGIIIFTFYIILYLTKIKHKNIKFYVQHQLYFIFELNSNLIIQKQRNQNLPVVIEKANVEF